MPTHWVLWAREYCDQFIASISSAARSSSMHSFEFRPRLMAPRAAASQLGTTFNLGGPSATASPTCDPSDRATSAILATKVIMVFLVCGCCWPIPIGFAGDGFGRRVGAWLTGFRTVCGRLPVVADTATLIAGPGDKADLLDRREVGTRARKHVADLVRALPRSVVEVFAEGLAGGVLERSDILSENHGRTGGDDAVHDVEAEWIEVAVLEAALALVAHPERHGLVGRDGEDRPFEHGLGLGGGAEPVLLCECRGRGRERRDRAYHEGTKHGRSPCRVHAARGAHARGMRVPTARGRGAVGQPNLCAPPERRLREIDHFGDSDATGRV